MVLNRAGIESLVIFALFFTAYVLIGHIVVVERHVVVFDGLSRLAHAFFAWYNDPPKLAAIGFEWPPVMTLVFLPAAAIKPLVTSFFALTVTAAAFGAGTLVLLNRTLGHLDMRWFLRYPLIGAMGANPMFAWYSMNGMAEMVFLFFLTFAVHYVIRWHLDAEVQHLALAGVGIALALLSRYELLAWAVMMSLLVFTLAVVRRRARAEVEGSMLLFTAPIVYCVFLWCFFNWLILGDGLFWLRRQAGTNITERGTAQKLDPVPFNEIVGQLTELNFTLFPLIPIMLIAMLVWALVRADLMALGLGIFIGLNAAMTAALVFVTHDKYLYQLRYNIRPMTIALIAVGWLFFCLRNRLPRFAVWGAALVILVVSVPITWQKMATFRYQFEEAAFVEALRTGRDQEGTSSLGNYRVGVGPDREMAAWISRHVTRRDAIQTDDAQTFSVMMATGRPDLFLDRIDKGDRYWKRLLTDPFGKVDYFLISRFGLPDLLRDCFPKAIGGGVPWLTVAHANHIYVLMRVSRYPPPADARLRGRAGPARRANIRCAQ